MNLLMCSALLDLQRDIDFHGPFTLMILQKSQFILSLISMGSLMILAKSSCSLSVHMEFVISVGDDAPSHVVPERSGIPRIVSLRCHTADVSHSS